MKDLQVPKTNLTLPTRFADTSLDDLREQIAISTRAYNVCSQYGLLKIEDLIGFYIRKGGFLNLRNTGRKTAEELESICRWLLDEQNLEENEFSKVAEEAQWNAWAREIAPSAFSTIQIDLLNAYIRQWHVKLSVRSQTAINGLTLGQRDYASLYHFFFEKQLRADQIRNVGKKSAQEIVEFIERLRMTAERVKQQSNDLAESDFAADQLCQAFNVNHDFLETYFHSIRDKKFPMFRFLHDLIVGESLFNNKQTMVLRSRLGWFRSEEVVELEKIGDQIGLTRERVRQIANHIEPDFLEKISFLKAQKNMLNSIMGDGYQMDTNRDLLYVRKQLADEINHIEGTDFSPKFFTLVYSVLHSETHTLFGSQFDFFQSQYLIRHDLLESFNMCAFIKDVEMLAGERINEDFSLDLDGYLLKFLKPDRPAAVLKRVRSICSDLLMLEFPERVRLELPNELIVCRNTKQQTWELVLEALETIGEPAKLDTIYRAIVQKHPKFDSNLEGLRGILLRERSQFISFSRTSTYGLARWESERNNIKGGTIRDITQEYLRHFPEPKHFYDITDFVLRYRPDTSPRSVHGTLMADESGRFKEFPGGFWGLAERSYQGFQVNRLSNHSHR